MYKKKSQIMPSEPNAVIYEEKIPNNNIKAGRKRLMRGKINTYRRSEQINSTENKNKQIPYILAIINMCLIFNFELNIL